MAKYAITDTTLVAVANAIREKNGESGNITPAQMPGKIAALCFAPEEVTDPDVLAGKAVTANAGRWYKYTGADTAVYTEGNLYSVKSQPPPQDGKLRGVWTFKETLTPPASNLSATLSYIDGGTVYTDTFSVTRFGTSVRVYIGMNTLYSTGGWVSGAVRTYDFGSAGQTVSADFLAFVESNADPVGNCVLEEYSSDFIRPADTHRVTFDIPGGEADTMTCFVPDGESIHANPYIPTVTGKTFTGWFSDATFAVEVTFPYTPVADTVLYAKMLDVSATLNSVPWATVSLISQSGQAANYWSLGDRKTVTLSGTAGTLALDGNYDVFIIDFAHNVSVEGSGISFGGFRFAPGQAYDGYNIALVDGTYGDRGTNKSFCMKAGTTATNAGGWRGSSIRRNALGSTDTEGGNASATTATNPVQNTLMSCFPSDLRAVMKPITKYSDNAGSGATDASAVSATVEYLPLMSEFELFGTVTKGNTHEAEHQTQYAYYVGNSPRTVRYNPGSMPTLAYCLTRTPHAGSSACFVLSFNGSAIGNGTTDGKAYNGYAVSPVFLV